MNTLGRQVVELLAPRIGRVTATNAVLLAASKIGVDPDRLTRENLRDVASDVSTILRVFLGPDAAAQIEAEIGSMMVEEVSR